VFVHLEMELPKRTVFLVAKADVEVKNKTKHV